MSFPYESVIDYDVYRNRFNSNGITYQDLYVRITIDFHNKIYRVTYNQDIHLPVTKFNESHGTYTISTINTLKADDRNIDLPIGDHFSVLLFDDHRHHIDNMLLFIDTPTDKSEFQIPEDVLVKRGFTLKVKPQDNILMDHLIDPCKVNDEDYRLARVFYYGNTGRFRTTKSARK